ncbi:MAG: 3-oxoacyl-[acyl-carrier-protein] reductase [Anaerolineae bacterium]|nr:3-oxoacyl-[acyl-carrier-protein] reductase [Anaerolineae bacterium]
MSQSDFEGKVALITGGSRGIGRQTALDLAARGADVVVNYRGNEAAAQEVVAAVEAAGRRSLALQADVSDFSAATDMVNTAVSAMGRLDILVNNAGVTRDTLLLRLSETDWDLVLDTVLKGTCACSKAALRPMMRQRYGRIINIGSVAGLGGNPGQTNYSAAKAGLVGFTKSLAKEVGSRSITVNMVAPGFVETEMTANLPPELVAEALRGTPLGRLGQPADISAAIVFLASEPAGFITGQVLSVDGGLLMH